MDQSERDLLLLGSKVDRNREWMDYHIAELRSIAADHTRKITALESRPASAVSPDQLPIFGALLKIILALIVPLLILAMTGDLKQAIAASKLIVGGG